MVDELVATLLDEVFFTQEVLLVIVVSKCDHEYALIGPECPLPTSDCPSSHVWGDILPDMHKRSITASYSNPLNSSFIELIAMQGKKDQFR